MQRFAAERNVEEDFGSTPSLANLLPSRWARAKRRSAVLKEYLRVPSRTMEETAAFAAVLGLGRTQFRLLARAFQEARTPSVDPAVRHHARVNDEVDREVTAAIAALGLDARQSEVHAAVLTACRRKGLVPPSFATVRRRLLDARSGVAPLESPSGRIVLDLVHLGVLVERDGETFRPRLVGAVDEGSGEPHGWDVDAGTSKVVQGARALLHAGFTTDNARARFEAGTPGRWVSDGYNPLLSRLGRHIGRISVFAPDGPVHARTSTNVVVEIADLRAVVDEILSATRRAGRHQL